MGKVGSGWQTTAAKSIRDGEDNVVFDGGHMVQFFVVYNIVCCFWRGSYNFLCAGVLLTKEKVLVVTHRAYIYRVLVYAFLGRKLVWRLYIILKI
jgi:hypothetical protein